MSLGLIVPTRGRPENAVRLADAVRDTSSGIIELFFVLDHDDPCRDEYLAAIPDWADVRVVPEQTRIRRMGPVLNYAARMIQDNFTHLGFMGDDHLPRTPGWDETLCDLLEKPGVAYGNDLFQEGKLPTACVVSSQLVRTLGYMSPPTLKHLYIDNFWLTLGNATSLFYAPDVIIEHLHPVAGKAPNDAGYIDVNSGTMYAEDGAAFQEFMRHQWPNDLARLMAELDS